MCAATSAPDERAASDDAPTSTPPWRRLTFTRTGWVAFAATCVALFVRSLPTRLTELTRLVAVTNAPHVGSLSVPPSVYVACAFALQMLSPLTFLTLAALIIWRRRDSLAAIRISALLIAFGAALPGVTYAIISGSPIWRVTPGALQVIGWASLLIFAYLFPDGRWVPRWSRFVVPLWALWVASFFSFAERTLLGHPLLIVASFLIWIAWLGTGVCAQLYRYIWVSAPPERQRSKWVALGFTGALVGILLVSAQHIAALTQGQTIHNSALFITLSLVIITLTTLPIPVSIAIAILRHNLYDIDRLINLTLVYGILTLTLGAIYAAAVGLSQVLIQAITGQQRESQLALVISTLGAAALFQPLRRRIQSIIDRRFYRKHYDAAQIIEAFAAGLRTELDLSELSQRLTEVTYRTMKPRHVSLWLAHPDMRASAIGSAEGAGRHQRDATRPVDTL